MRVAECREACVCVCVDRARSCRSLFNIVYILCEVLYINELFEHIEQCLAEHNWGWEETWTQNTTEVAPACPPFKPTQTCSPMRQTLDDITTSTDRTLAHGMGGKSRTTDKNDSANHWHCRATQWMVPKPAAGAETDQRTINILSYIHRINV